jgi:GNAT superfamily N-acetyltransferase
LEKKRCRIGIMYIRLMRPDDLGILLDMAHSEGWSSDLFEFEHYLEHNKTGCFVCVEDHTVVGGVMTFAYPKSGWIGNLIVHRPVRLRGFGKALLRRAIQNLSRLPAQFLCAAPSLATGLYSKCGFHTIGSIYRWESTKQTFIQPEYRADIQHILDIDRKYWCEDRSQMLIPILNHRSYLVDDGACLGFGMVGDHWTIGPWEAKDKESAADLLDRILVKKKGYPILVNVPAHNTDACDILRDRDFKIKSKTVFMCRGDLPPIAFGNIYGLASMGSKG